MNISIISFGKFHAFELAKVLKDNNLNISIYSSYPFYMARNYNIDKKNYYSFFLFQLLDRLSKRIFSRYIKIFFGLIYINLLIKKQDYYILWSDTPAFIAESLKRKYKNSKIIIERSSIHIQKQDQLLKNEFKKMNLKFKISEYDIKNEILNYGLADFISVPSTYVFNSFVNSGIDKKKIFVNPLGCNFSLFKKIEKRDNKFRVISCGLASIQKGTTYLIDAINKLPKDVEIEYWHLGKISPELKQIVLNTNSNIIFKGGIKKNLLYKYYSQGSVFVLPSIQDGFGMVILESMACGLPVICSENTGIRDIISDQGNEGFIVEPADSDIIASKLLYLYNNHEILLKMGKNAKSKVTSEFSWGNYGSRYFDFLKKFKNK
jgi:glycosyltransferase involved in cell wall biosynthesis